MSTHLNILNLDSRIFSFKIPEGRRFFKNKIKNKNINLIDESYNSNPLSLKSAISNF